MNKKIIFLFLSAFLLLQAFFISSYLPFSEWFSPSTIYTDDYALHYGDVMDKKFLLQNFGATWGYNPFQRAGTISNVIVGIDNNGWALWAFLLPFLPTAVAFKLYVVFLILIIPLLLYGAARNFGLENGERLLCVVLGTFFPFFSICVDFIYWGTVSYIASVYISLYIASLAYRFFQTGSLRALLLQALLLGATFWIHIFTVINCITFIMVLYLVSGLRQNRQRMALSLASLVASGLLAAPWVIPFLKFLETSGINPLWTPYVTNDLFEWANTYIRGRFLLNTYAAFPKPPYIDAAIMLFGIAGLARWKQAGAGRLAAAFGGTAALLFVFAYFGSFASFTRTLTPLRFTLMMNVYLILPASVALCFTYRRLTAMRPRIVRPVLAACAIGVLCMLAARPFYHLFVEKRFQLLTQLPSDMHRLIDYIETKTSNDARILIENSDWESGHQYACGHFPTILPHLTGREFIGNDCWVNPTYDSRISYFFGLLFQQPIDTLHLDDVKILCDLYNLGWVICWSQASKEFYNRYPDYFVPDGSVAQFDFYRVNRELSFFLKGSGAVRAEANRIELRNLAPEKGEIILSYHWMKYFKTDPPTAMERVFLSDDPTGFIKLKNPPPDVLIYNDYR